MSEKDELAGIIADELNKQFKHQMFFLKMVESNDVTDFFLKFNNVRFGQFH